MIFTSPAFAIDTYQETFNSMEDAATINGVDSWVVASGDPNDALIESGATATGSGKALKLSGVLSPAEVNRPASYGNLSPTWIEYVVKPGMGADERDIPESGIAAVTFSPTGSIMASDGTNWVSTGKTFSTSTWYRVILRVDFSTHLYDIYTEPVSTPKTPFVPDKQNLNFIDPTISSMSRVGMMGAFNARSQADSLTDEVIVQTVDKIQFITSPHTLVKGYASGMITAQLQNANSEPQTAWKDLSFELQSSVQTGEFSLDNDNWVPVTAVTLPEGAQQVFFYYKDFTEGRPAIRVSEFPDRGWTDATQEQKVVNEGEFFSTRPSSIISSVSVVNRCDFQ